MLVSAVNRDQSVAEGKSGELGMIPLCRALATLLTLCADGDHQERGAQEQNESGCIHCGSIRDQYPRQLRVHQCGFERQAGKRVYDLQTSLQIVPAMAGLRVYIKHNRVSIVSH